MQELTNFFERRVSAYQVGVERRGRASTRTSEGGAYSRRVSVSVEHARRAGAPLPLHEDGALVGALHEAPLTVLALGDQQVHGAPDAEEARGGHGQGPRQHLLHDRALQAEGVEPGVEHAHEVVLGVAERLAGDRPRVGQRPRYCAAMNRSGSRSTAARSFFIRSVSNSLTVSAACRSHGSSARCSRPLPTSARATNSARRS